MGISDHQVQTTHRALPNENEHSISATWEHFQDSNRRNEYIQYQNQVEHSMLPTDAPFQSTHLPTEHARQGYLISSSSTIGDSSNPQVSLSLNIHPTLKEPIEARSVKRFMIVA